MIAAVTLAGKEERARRITINTATSGLNHKPYVNTEVEIRDNLRHQHTYATIKLPPHIQGKHKYDTCQQLYVDIHRILSNCEWAP